VRQREDATCLWITQLPQDLHGQRYSYLVDVVTPDAGLVRNRVTDPYAVSVTANSRHSLAHPDTPPGWDSTPRPQTVAHATDLVVYELHVRDFSRDDARSNMTCSRDTFVKNFAVLPLAWLLRKS
jgi:pullulanase